MAAKFAHPDRPVIALVGDGAMQMNGIAALITIARYCSAMDRPAARRLRAAQQRPQPGHLGAAGDGRRPEVRRLPDAARLRLRRATRAARAARRAASTAPRTSVPAWDECAGRRPARGAGVRDRPEVPPLPPHVRFEQAKGMARRRCTATRATPRVHQAGSQAEGQQYCAEDGELMSRPHRGTFRRGAHRSAALGGDRGRARCR